MLISTVICQFIKINFITPLKAQCTPPPELKTLIACGSCGFKGSQIYYESQLLNFPGIQGMGWRNRPQQLGHLLGGIRPKVEAQVGFTGSSWSVISRILVFSMIWRDLKAFVDWFCCVLVLVLRFCFLEFFEKRMAGLEKKSTLGDLYRRWWERVSELQA